MTLNRRQKILLVVLLFLFLLAAVAGGIVWKRRSKPAPVSTPVPVAEEPLPPRGQRDTEQGLPLFLGEEAELVPTDLWSLSQTFAERYGSYSSESDFANARDLLPLMSAAFVARTLASMETAVPSSGYYGVTTRFLSVKVTAQNDAAGTASAEVQTQREEASGSVQDVQVRYQVLQLVFVKEQSVWKVDDAVWLP